MFLAVAFIMAVILKLYPKFFGIMTVILLAAWALFGIQYFFFSDKEEEHPCAKYDFWSWEKDPTMQEANAA